MSIGAKQVSGQILAITAPGRVAPGVPYDALAERVGNAADPVLPQDLVTLAFLAAVADRRDHSVNGASVDNFRSRRPIMRTKTNVNPAGGYNGSGTGNKSILGHYLPGPPYPAGGTMPLGALATIEYTYDRLAPEVTGVNIVPYVNLMVRLNPFGPPAPAPLPPFWDVVMVLGDFGNAVPTGVFTPPALPVGPSTTQSALWTAATDLVLVVNFEGMALPTGFPGPAVLGLWTPIVTPSFGAPPSYTSLVPLGPSPGNWPGTGYKIGGGGPMDILVAYPDAIILNVNPFDGGLPKGVVSPGPGTIMSGITLNLGSSGNVIQNAIEILDWKINGVPV